MGQFTCQPRFSVEFKDYYLVIFYELVTHILATTIIQRWLNEIDPRICDSDNSIFVIWFHSEITDFLIEINWRSRSVPRSISLILKHCGAGILIRFQSARITGCSIRFHRFIPKYLILFLTHISDSLSNSKFSLKLLQFFIVILLKWGFKLALKWTHSFNEPIRYQIISS